MEVPSQAPQAHQQLELEWSRFNGLDPQGMVCCNSGTAALHLALEALQLPQGSEVLLPDFCMLACARAVTLASLTPVLVDVGEDALLGPVLANQAVGNSPLIQAAMLVHTYGRRCEMYWTDGHEFAHPPCRIIEDLAEAHGVKPHLDTDAACWSHYRNKSVGGEEGGTVWFRNPEHAALARQLRNLGFNTPHDYTHIPRGHNYRLANCLAEKVLANGLGWYGFPLHRGQQSDNYVRAQGERRREIEGWYNDACPPEWHMPKRDAVWVYDLRIRGMSRETQDRVVTALRVQGIEARHGFKPISRQEEYKRCRWIGSGRIAWCPDETNWEWLGESVADVLSREVIYLPAVPGVTTREMCQKAIEVIKREVGHP